MCVCLAKISARFSMRGAHLTALREEQKIADIRTFLEAVSLQDFEEADIAQRLDICSTLRQTP